MNNMPSSFHLYRAGEFGERPWGQWRVLDVQPNVVVKKLYLNPKGRISLQRHKYRTERWIVISGTATVRRGDEISQLSVGESVLIPCGSLHRLSNETCEPLCLIEIQLGELLSEEDIERFTDDYGRVN